MEIRAVNAAGTLLVSGAIDDWEAVRSRGVDTLVDLDGTVDPGLPEAPNEILYVYFPIVDDELPDLSRLHALGRLVADLVLEQHVVLVHCLLGLNRSNLLLGTALTYLGMTGERAFAHLRAIQPACLYNEAFAAYIRGLPARPLRAERPQ